MILTLMSISLISSITFLFLKHPMSMGLTLLIQTVMVALTLGFFNLNFWYSYILFLVMIGGMMVLFVYMTSVASNEKFAFSTKIFTLILLMSLLMIFTIIMLDPYYSNINNMNLEKLNCQTNFILSLNKFINYPMSIILFLLILYLLITLIAIVKITNIKSGPLRPYN
uniref:NADH-ubiquinone oxidoreductase chain 6 n=1 Tax=Polyphylla gracilicornis TaxID=1618307 RepID=A0A7S9DEH2_9SCAR|nr:NADH dehydrogenase subunit 6 [Polyphylla gracilicornis]QPF96305.1 NADH dehydrogenase subunit 6 [Polyphylla gracilicornis]